MGKATKILFAITVINFGIWGIVTSVIHGDAINGKIVNGTYYVAMKGHYTKVSRNVYLYSYLHTCSQFVLFPALVLVGFIETIRRHRKAKRSPTIKPSTE
ncbi:MAG: hypothetical protein P8182_09895 [Deltaproteobacteria bacterium]